jgi:hypothetical protein
VAVDDIVVGEVGDSGIANILTNDTLGSPPALLDPILGLPDGGSAVVGTRFDVRDGTGAVVATTTVSSDGTIGFTFIAEGVGSFDYVLSQGGGTYSATVFVEARVPVP